MNKNVQELIIYKVYQENKCYFIVEHLNDLSIKINKKIFINEMKKELKCIDEKNIFDLLNYISKTKNIILKAIEIK